MSLHSGKRIHGYEWEELPIDEHVIERVEALAESEKQMVMHRGMPSFEWAPGVPIEEEFEDDREGILTIADGITDEPHLADINDVDVIEMIEGDNDNQHVEEIEEEAVPIVDEGLIIVPEDDIVSEEEEFIETEEENQDESGKKCV